VISEIHDPTETGENKITKQNQLLSTKPIPQQNRGNKVTKRFIILKTNKSENSKIIYISRSSLQIYNEHRLNPKRLIFFLMETERRGCTEIE
jgi:hypothetical protein